MESEDYLFWSGYGDPEYRAATYRERLKKIFIAAKLRVYPTMKKKKSGGKTKAEPEMVLDSHADPHFWRHTWVRDAYIAGIDIEDIAKVLGDDVSAVKQYYSCFDELRHRKVVTASRRVRELRISGNGNLASLPESNRYQTA